MKYIHISAVKGRFTLMFMSLVFVACNSDEIQNTQPKPSIGSITITQPGYTDVMLRTTQLSKDTVITLGDDLEAEVHIERVRDVTTRAGETPTSSTYTLAAYQNGQLVKKTTGTVNGATFTPDNEFKLGPGTYDFVAYNNGITASTDGSELIAKHENAATARLAVTKNQTIIAGSPFNLSLDAKHVGSRIVVQLKALMNFTLTDAKLSNTEEIPMIGTYRVADNTWNYTKGNLPTEIAQHFPATSKGDPLTGKDNTEGTGSLTYTDEATVSNARDYQYFLPSTNANSLTLTFKSGEMYKKSLANKSIKLITQDLAANGSYIIQLKLNRLFKYLFQDGTTDYLKNKGSRTPIALVIDPVQKIAVALEEEPVNMKWATSGPGTDAKTVYANIQDVVGVYNGFDETWSADNSASGQVRGNNTAFKAMYSAATWWANQLQAKGITLTNGMGEGSHRWYLPSLGEIVLFYNNIGYSNITADNITQAYDQGHILPWYGQGLQREAFIQAGGTVPTQRWYSSTATSLKGDNHVFHTWTQWSTAVNNGTTYRNQINFNSTLYTQSPGNPCTARAFIRYK
uniref:Fimbrillin family protein n=2 Tax=unclassified Prevotella TaxID=2638335 RepID=A0AB33J421_9BACT